MITKIKYLIVLITGMALYACAPKPAEINYGFDQCVYCRMTIVDPKFGAEIVTDKGRALKFDAIECMVRYDQESDPPAALHLVNTVTKPGALVPAASCHYLISPAIPSPMGANLSAHLNFDAMSDLQGDQATDPVTWDDLPAQLFNSK